MSDTLRALAERRRGLAEVQAEMEKPAKEAAAKYDAEVKKTMALKRESLVDNPNPDVYGHLPKSIYNEETLAELFAKQWMESEPRYYSCPENAKMLITVIDSNGLSADVYVYQQVFEILREANLLVRRPKAETKVSQEPEARPTGFRDTIQREQVPDCVKGYDDEGREVEYTGLQVEAFSADQYKRRIMGLRFSAKSNAAPSEGR